MNKIRISALLLTFIVSVSAFFTVSAEPQANTSEETGEATSFPNPRAKAAYLYDLEGDRVIYENNSSEKNFPASITKIMTALLVLEKGDLSETVTVSETALADITYLHSRLGLKTGEEISVKNLLLSLLVCSANDSANVLAEYVSGDIGSFVELMNTRAKELGMTGTSYVNPHGFHDDNHYSTAEDIAIVAKEAIKHPTFCEMVKVKTAKIPATNLNDERTISSTNHLISRYRNTFHYYPYATGLKTGSTDEAGSCLVATAEKKGIKLLSIVLGCDNENLNELAYSFVDTKAMFEYVFNNYQKVTIATVSDVVSDSKVFEAQDGKRVALCPSKDVIILLPKSYTAKTFKPTIDLADNISAPIEKGTTLGHATYSFSDINDEIKIPDITVDLLAANEVKRDNFLHLLNGVAGVIFSPIVMIPLLLIIAVLIINTINRNKRKKQRRRKLKSQAPVYRSSLSSSSRTSSQLRSGTSQRPSRPRTSNHSTRQRSSRPTSRTPDPWDKYR